MKHIFIINKISGKGTAYKNVGAITEIAQNLGIDYEIELTQYEGHAQKIAEKYQDSDNHIYAVGGDGTLLEVLNGISKTQILSIIPAGSGNDFYRYFKKPPYDLKEIIAASINAPIRKIDIGISQQRRFLNCCSFGIDADVNADASNLIRNTFVTKGPAYIMSVLKNVISLNPKKVTLQIDGQTYSGKYFLVALMNGAYYGNGVPAAPLASVDDGYFDLCLYPQTNRSKAYPFLVKYMQGKHQGCEGFEVIKCKHLVVDADEHLSCQEDGENYLATHLEIKIEEQFLNLKLPDYRL